MKERRGRPRLPARLKKWNGDWHVFYTERSGGRPATKRVLGSAHGAVNAEERRDLLQQYRKIEQEQEGQANRFGQLQYGSPLITALDVYKQHVKDQEKLRTKTSAARVGVAEATAKTYLDTLDRFKTWLRKNGLGKVQTGQVSSDHLRQFFDDLAAEKTKHGERTVQRGPHTLNKHKRQLRAAFLHLAGLRPPLFPDVDQLRRAFKPHRTDNVQPSSFSPDQLTAFLAEALSDEDVVQVVTVRRQVTRKRDKQVFQQKLGDRNRPVAKVSRLFLVLALTGCRLGEALMMKFSDIDFRAGLITVRSQKTGLTRWVPLNAIEKQIGAQFLALLKKWKLEGHQYLVSDRDADEPSFPKGVWDRVCRNSRQREIGPQALRQNFTSYAAALGVPAAVSALWQGHSAAVAEKWYRTIVRSRIEAEDFESTMGLKDIITQMISGNVADVISIHRTKMAPPPAAAAG